MSNDATPAPHRVRCRALFGLAWLVVKSCVIQWYHYLTAFVSATDPTGARLLYRQCEIYGIDRRAVRELDVSHAPRNWRTLLAEELGNKWYSHALRPRMLSDKASQQRGICRVAGILTQSDGSIILYLDPRSSRQFLESKEEVSLEDDQDSRLEGKTPTDSCDTSVSPCGDLGDCPNDSSADTARKKL